MHHIVVPKIGAAQAWREAARKLLGAGVPPEQVIWGDTASCVDLFAQSATLRTRGSVRVPRSFVSMANSVVWHSDPQRFARLYAFLWRLCENPALMADRGDADLARLRGLEKNVHRCQHKMKAFVRFRDIGSSDTARRSFAAWFEPTHHTVEPTADFFVRRFGDMDWRIITPDVSAQFVDGKLTLADGQQKPDLPEDGAEQLWITYFRNIFNPARLKVSAMQSEMPKKYWKNMPEAAAIPELIAGAPMRARQMADAAPSLPPSRMEQVQAQLSGCQSAWDGPTEALPAAIAACTRCPLYRSATQAVPGEGPSNADLMIVGEQPGDAEDLVGKPFVGPAGRLFDQIAQDIGLNRQAAYVTNAVKHFKFRPSGKRRLHQRPSASEIQHCRWWLKSEVELIKPKLIVALGATATQSLTGRGTEIMKRRGKIEPTIKGGAVLITLHPSHLLRQKNPTKRQEAEDALRKDLRLAAAFAQAD